MAIETRERKPGQPSAAVMELVFWEALVRCAEDETVPLELKPCTGDDRGGIAFGRRIPPALWEHMADALQDLNQAAGLSDAFLKCDG